MITLTRHEVGADVVADALGQDEGAVTAVNVAEVLEREIGVGGDPNDRPVQAAESQTEFSFSELSTIRYSYDQR